MTPGRHLTGCAASDHPEPAVAVGEVVGRLQNTLAGSPQFALVLIDQRIGAFLSNITAAVHSLLGPDLALAVAAPRVAGADHLAPERAALAVWALCGVDVAVLGDDELAPSTGRPPVISMDESDHRRRGGSVAVEFAAEPDAPRPLFISGDGTRRRPSRAGVVFPAGSATVVRSGGEREVGPVMEATDARGRTLRRLDHVPARAVLLDQLETTEAFVDGPSPEFPPLRAAVLGRSEPREHDQLVDVVAVDGADGSIELAAGIAVGDRVQLLTYDPDAATRRIAARLLESGQPGDRAVLVDHDLPMLDGGDLDRIPTAAVLDAAAGGTGGAAGLRPWSEVSALSVRVVDDD